MNERDNTERRTSNERRANPAFKVPYALILPMWTIIGSLFGVWYSQDKANRDNLESIRLLNKDMASVSKSVSLIQKQLSIMAYTRREAEQDKEIIGLQLEQMRSRLASLESHRK